MRDASPSRRFPERCPAMTRSSTICLALALALCVAGCVGCDDGPPPAPKYFERTIQPILTQNCVFNQGACHKDDGHGNSLGNLDLTSYAAVTRRRDVLRNYGSF